MAASFYSNSVHVDFESALAMGEPGMVSMFQALIASGLQGFLGCPAVVYEEALVEFFVNGTVRNGLKEPIPKQIMPAESAVEPMVEDQQAETEDATDRPATEEETPADLPADAIVNVEQRVDESVVEVSGVHVVDPETVIQQVLNQLNFITEGQDVTKGDRVETWFDRALAEEISTAGDD
ncbi:BTB/POZ domain-containing protein-like [Dorcoceras hygrometricum]|uniref:BTB/POZ domain-containing protein-like n=1 Tax=Dorcoceras hygrometricum TaxID=472368 RepID=A0A2Z7CYW4_9LAMI|nr:BTB/POZ domain-containing protein-like [Dorcoceras hygrometricum]